MDRSLFLEVTYQADLSSVYILVSFSLTVRKYIQDSDLRQAGLTPDHSLRFQSLMVEKLRLQNLEAAGRMVSMTRRQRVMTAAAAQLCSLLILSRTPAREWCQPQ